MFVQTLGGAEKVTEMKLNRPAVIYNKTLFRFSTDDNNVCHEGFCFVCLVFFFYSHFYYITQLLRYRLGYLNCGQQLEKK